ncbi:hypothetical protein DL98DRAFT_281957 [Cadophora sp. DSE1049]|nr:hypothetical protein DL98DRAFT_281957 [Cadophora sp. DSE1049]
MIIYHFQSFSCLLFMQTLLTWSLSLPVRRRPSQTRPFRLLTEMMIGAIRQGKTQPRASATRRRPRMAVGAPNRS